MNGLKDALSRRCPYRRSDGKQKAGGEDAAATKIVFTQTLPSPVILTEWSTAKRRITAFQLGETLRSGSTFADKYGDSSLRSE